MADLEKNTELPKQGVEVSVGVRCGDCFHFEKQRADKFADVCSRLGILKMGRPCKYFLVNANTVSFKTKEQKEFSEILSNVPTSKLSMMAALIVQERQTRRQGFKHGQKVYVNLYLGEYISNYAQAWIILATKSSVIVQGKKSFRGSFLKNSILSEEEFLAKKKALAVRGRFVDPKLKTYSKWRPKIVPKAVKDYEPPTIDDIYKEQTKKPPVKSSKSNEISIRGGDDAEK